MGHTGELVEVEVTEVKAAREPYTASNPYFRPIKEKTLGVIRTRSGVPEEVRSGKVLLHTVRGSRLVNTEDIQKT